jgi:hypothetical protein
MSKSILMVLGVCLVAVLACAFFTEEAYAQDYMDRKGLGGLLDGMKDTTGKGPSTLEKAIGIGSCVVMIAVVKWL